MEKLLSRFGLLIGVIIALAVSFLFNSIGDCFQGEIFVLSILIFIFLISIIIIVQVLRNIYATKKILLIILMFLIYAIVFVLSCAATKILNVEFKAAFQLITIGIALGNTFFFQFNK